MISGKFVSIILFSCLLSFSAPILPGARAAENAGLFKDHLVYVPIYSHVYHGDYERQILLTGILSVRNTDPALAITLVKVDYYDSDGKLIKKYLSGPITLKPMASTRFIVKESDTHGGSGANFLVQWQAEKAVNEPIMESVMIGTAGQQGISFTSRGQELKNK
jgi:hypothetical protein